MVESKKTFNDLSKIKCKLEKKGRFNYVSWVQAWSEFKKVYPNANFKVYETEVTVRIGEKVKKTTVPYFESNAGSFVKVGVTNGDIEYIEHYPVLNFANKSVKGEMLDVFDINTSIKRAMVKAISYFGLGLYVYDGEDLPPTEEKTKK